MGWEEGGIEDRRGRRGKANGGIRVEYGREWEGREGRSCSTPNFNDSPPPLLLANCRAASASLLAGPHSVSHPPTFLHQ